MSCAYSARKSSRKRNHGRILFNDKQYFSTESLFQSTQWTYVCYEQTLDEYQYSKYQYKYFVLQNCTLYFTSILFTQVHCTKYWYCVQMYLSCTKISTKWTYQLDWHEKLFIEFSPPRNLRSIMNLVFRI